MLLSTNFNVGETTVSYTYDPRDKFHSLKTSPGCSHVRARGTFVPGEVVNWLAPFRTTFDDTDDANVLIRFLMSL